MKKSFNPAEIEKKSFLIQKGMTFVLRDEKVTVLAAGQDFTVLDHGNGKKSYPHPMELVSAYKCGLLIFKVEENVVIANKQFTKEHDKQKARIVEAMVLELHQEANKFSIETQKKVIKRVAKRLNLDLKDIPSPSTLRRWYLSWIENEMDIYPVIRQQKKSRAKRHNHAVVELAEQTIDQYFLVPAGLTRRQTYFKFVELFEEMVGTEDSPIDKDTKIISESRFYEMLHDLNQVDVIYSRQGKDQARKFARESQGKYVLDFPLQRVEIDALHLKIGINDDETGEFLGTVIVYLAIDCFTRCIVGYSLSFGTRVAEQAEAVIELIKHCISPKSKSPLADNDWPLTGVPFAFYGDAGKAFNCREVKHFCAQIKCNYVTTETKSPWKKAFVESLNRTIRMQFARVLPGYSRNNEEDKKDKSIEELATLTLGEFINLLEYFILDYYHQNSHRGLYGNSPANECAEALKECSPRLVKDLSKLDLVGGFEHEGVIQGCAGIQKNNLFYQSDVLNNLRLELHKHGAKGNPKVPYLYSVKDVSKITVINELTGELIQVSCNDPRVEPGMSLSEFRSKLGLGSKPSATQKVFSRCNQVVSDALKRKATELLMKNLDKREKSSQTKNGEAVPPVSDVKNHVSEHVEKQKRRTARNHTGRAIQKSQPAKRNYTRPQTN
jgi:putative transposase